MIVSKSDKRRRRVAMANTVTLEQVEALVGKLTPTERLKLAARICDELSAQVSGALQDNEEEHRLQERLRLADELLAECSGIEDDAQGTDPNAVIRRLREERISQICPKDASTPASR
jgi:hypothetical protein